MLGSAFGLGLWAGSGVVRAAHAAGARPYAGFATLARVLGTIEAQYIEARSTETLLASATRGLAAELDPHSSWMDPATWTELQQSADGVVDGTGMTVRLEAGAVVVSTVTAGGPADLAGVEAGDTITHVEGSPVASAEAAARALSGERGTEKTVTVLRQEAVKDLSVLLDVVEEQVVFVSRDTRGVTVAIRHFSRATASQLDRALNDLGLQPEEPILLDLRNNPGGLMEQAVAVVDRFVGAGMVAETRGRAGRSLQIDRSRDDEQDLANPLAVLVDGDTASAAEVVAGALRDRDRALLIGRQTYGKGTVQQVYALEDGSALKLTRARYHLPSGRALADREGLVPDVVVPAERQALRARLHDTIQSADLPADERAALSQAIEAALPEAQDTDPIVEAGWKTLGR